MRKNQLQSLLDQIAVIIQKEKDIKQRQYESGETYNVFEVLKLQRSEVRLHSAFIASLLDPQGPHGLRTKFLESFLQIMRAEGILQDLDTVTVEPEKPIGFISKKGDEGGRMDIVLEDKHNHAIVIENKIDAGDQPKQLLRYDNYCKKNYREGNYRIYYLTKWGVEPSEESCGGKNVDYWMASYNEDILSWLDNCMELSKMVQPVNETIKQYRTNLVEILNIMSQKSEKEFLSIVTAESNVGSTITILENSWIIERKIRFDFLQKLIVLAREYGFTCDLEEAELLADLNKNSFLRLISPSRSLHYGIFIGNDTPKDGFWFAIKAIDKTRISKTVLQQLKPQWGDRRGQRIDLPYGSDYFWSETGEEVSGSWWEWDNIETLKAMCDGRFLSFIEKKIIQTTVDNHLLENLESILN